MTLTRSLRLGLVALGLAVSSFLIAAIVGRGGDQSAPQTSEPLGRDSVSVAEVANPGDLSGTIAALQTRLDRLPTDSDSWAALGSAYIQQARITGQPDYYAKASGALDRSLEESPDRNYAALTGQSALASARHDFHLALKLARQSERINRFSAANQGMLVDALVELGRYREATQAAQRMIDLKPGVPSYTRVSYIFELRGELQSARYAMQQALQLAYSPDDKAFALFQLGELAFNSGDPETAAKHYATGLELAPSYVPLLYGEAKAAAAMGDTEQAVSTFQTVVDRLPLPGYLKEYADLLESLGRDDEAEQQRQLIAAQQQILESAGVDVDAELALYDADNGQPERALQAGERAFAKQKGIFTEDVYAWALHVNGRDREALPHIRNANRLGTKSALLAYHQGAIEQALGKDAAAAESYARALDINPYFSPLQAPLARQALSELRAGR
ncbi:MAG: hypothetical protein M3423_06360 [Actinomycetota bacterium]|nr:hypothetical protein [Actinomycetota bacterium]